MSHDSLILSLLRDQLNLFYVVFLLWVIICNSHKNGNSKMPRTLSILYYILCHLEWCLARLVPNKCLWNEWLNTNANQNGRHSAEFLFKNLFFASWILGLQRLMWKCQEMLSQTQTGCYKKTASYFSEVYGGVLLELVHFLMTFLFIKKKNNVKFTI